jgi:hypothetical protein
VVSGGCELDVWELLVLDGCVPEKWVMPESVVAFEDPLLAFEDPLLEVAVREPSS